MSFRKRYNFHNDSIFKIVENYLNMIKDDDKLISQLKITNNSLENPVTLETFYEKETNYLTEREKNIRLVRKAIQQNFV